MGQLREGGGGEHDEESLEDVVKGRKQFRGGFRRSDGCLAFLWSPSLHGPNKWFRAVSDLQPSPGGWCIWLLSGQNQDTGLPHGTDVDACSGTSPSKLDLERRVSAAAFSRARHWQMTCWKISSCFSLSITQERWAPLRAEPQTSPWVNNALSEG